ncbi:AAA-domain-containing protein [Suhomyces tanzawaensis NRRL Y-17324]|uniref:Peroxisomal ATPase PEX6 n=1 Tax=Suhomyces tanzawaensis NRRL Y-17324 TaxID=984487 RepID=A0A1E4SK10_9ASCO|nr:AAA-domain-containing protein [Suhomyces tanzawaensis NRRL Y-17324]ODV79767.1 AAA-domain-containing protein [Suhomyces tanzawaensis NRRL Y-17324]
MPSAIVNNTSPRSISTIANVTFINNKLIDKHDVLEISIDLFNKIFPDQQGHESKFVLIKLIGSPDFFKSFRIFKINSIDFENQKNTIKFINNTNINIQFTEDQLTLNSAIIQSVSTEDIPKLSRVYVSVPGEVYSILSNKPQDSTRAQFLTTFLAHNGSVANESDYIRLINGQIKLCEPVSQGFIDYDTKIVLIKDNEYPQGYGGVNNFIEEVEIENDDDDEEIPNVEELDISSYLSSSLQFNAGNDSIKSSEFNVRPLPEPITIEGLPKEWAKDDTEAFVFMNSSDFIKLGFPIFNGDLSKLHFGSKLVIVRVFTLAEPNKIFKSGNVYLSPILIINLDLNPESSITFEPISTTSAQQLSTYLPIAESAIISRISSPITMDKTYQKHFFSSLKTSLSNYFKCVQKGDYFPVVIDSVLAKTMFDNATGEEDGEDENGSNDAFDVIPTGDPDAVAWFKIVDIKGVNDVGTEQFIIDPTQTLLVSSGVEFVRLPKNEFSQWYNYLKLPPSFNFNSHLDKGDFPYAKDLKKIIQTCLSSKINLKTTVMLQSLSRGIGKTSLIRNLSTELGLNLIELDCFDLINPGQELKTIGFLMGRIDKIIANATSDSSCFHIIYLKHIESLCPQVDTNDQNSNIHTSLSLKIVQTLNDYLTQYGNMIVVMSCNDFDKVNDNIKLMVKFNITFNVPSESERLQIFKFLIGNEFNGNFDITSSVFVLRQDINYKTLALQSAGLTPRDLTSIIKKSKTLAIKRLTKLAMDSDITLNKLIKIGNGGLINWIPEDFNLAINEARNQFSDSIGAPRIPNVKWEDIGGLDLVKDEILDTIDMPLKHPELFNNGLKKRSGILFYGPPGTGKTLLAKAIATNFSLNFFSVKGPELLNMYIGESEANVRRVFQRARDAKPCVIFFDELDSVAPKRGNQGDSGGVMDRIVSQLLAELDGMSGGGDGGDGVFVVGATNRPDLLDEALLRPGRFDKMLYLGISDTNDKQTKILEALTRKFKLHEDVDLAKIAEKCTFTFTGADFYALCSDSMLNAMTRVANEVDAKIKKFNADLVNQGKATVSTRWWFDNAATEEDINVLVKMEDFLKAQRELSPSVSAEELQHYLRVRENFEGGKEKAKQAETNGVNK